MNESSCVFDVINKTVKDSNNRLSVKELCKTAGGITERLLCLAQSCPDTGSGRGTGSQGF